MHKVTLRVEENLSPERRSKLHQVMLRSQKKRKKRKVKAQSCSVNLKKVRRKVFQKLPLTNSRSQLQWTKRRESLGNRKMTVKRRSKRLKLGPNSCKRLRGHKSYSKLTLIVLQSSKGSGKTAKKLKL